MTAKKQVFRTVGFAFISLAVLGYTFTHLLERCSMSGDVAEIPAPPFYNAIVDATIEEIDRQISEDPDIVNRPLLLGFYPIHYAATTGRLDVIQLLIDRGADPNQRAGPYQATPLVAAVESGDTDVIELLLDSGADPSITMSDGLTILDYAREIGTEQTVRTLEQAIESPSDP